MSLHLVGAGWLPAGGHGAWWHCPCTSDNAFDASADPRQIARYTSRMQSRQPDGLVGLLVVGSNKWSTRTRDSYASETLFAPSF